MLLLSGNTGPTCDFGAFPSARKYLKWRKRKSSLWSVFLERVDFRALHLRFRVNDRAQA